MVRDGFLPTATYSFLVHAALNFSGLVLQVTAEVWSLVSPI